MTSGFAARATNYEGWSSTQLIERIKDLESQVALQVSPRPPSTKSSLKPVKVNRPFDFDKYPSRYIAIKYAYLGWHYSGLAYNDPDATSVPTVEFELFKALEKVKLIQNSESCNYSRCGRTDRGVSAMSQVSAMIVRSNVQPEDRTENGGSGHTIDETGTSKGPELDYTLMLNKVLPETIRVIAWSPVPEDFSARFSCRGRHYRYFFTNMEGELDIDAMRKAAGYFLGENDFRNFCKLDLQKQITNFKRRIDRANIVPYDGLPPSDNSKMWTFELQGTAFLWHQVRCMMAILFLVGQRLEEPEIVRDMLDVDKYPTKPEYVMASDVPLVLYDCLFEGMNWIYPEKNGRVRQKDLGDCFAMWHESKLHETLTGLFCNAVSQSQGILLGRVDGDRVCVLDGSGDQKPTKSYHKVAKRKRQEAFSILNERYLKSARYENRQQKREAKAKDGLLEDDS